MIERDRSTLDSLIAEYKYPLLFATISGSHLYGFPSADSDYDVRGAHVLPAREVVGLATGPDTIEQSKVRDGIELDMVSHDLKKFCTLMLKRNGYVLEQLLSPHVLVTSDDHQELMALAKTCITRGHAYHYLGFAEASWIQYCKKPVKRIKPLLYAFRVLLTGIHLMRSGEIEANIVALNETHRLGYLYDLVAKKTADAELAMVPAGSSDLYEREYERLRGELEDAYKASTLPEQPSCELALDAFLIRVRLDGITGQRTA
ncbi:MAG: nucleotidyltransferase domain-containing protein [Capsulimonadaceae bacterium]|nr:nucleotidyltransferase domain-containing protein [Capsulimonadaceae bacterium]